MVWVGQGYLFLLGNGRQPVWKHSSFLWFHLAVMTHFTFIEHNRVTHYSGFSVLSASTQQLKPASWNRPSSAFSITWSFPKGCRDGAALQFQLRSPLSFQAAQLIPPLSCTYPEEALKYSILSQSIRNWSSCLSSSREEIQFPWSWREAWNLWMNTITNSMKLIIKDRERLRGPGWVDRKNKTISPFQIYTEASSS